VRYYIINKRVKSLFNSCRINQNSQKMNNIMKHEYNSTNEKKKRKRLKNTNILISTIIIDIDLSSWLSLNANDESSTLVTQPAIVWLWPILFFLLFVDGIWMKNSINRRPNYSGKKFLRTNGSRNIFVCPRHHHVRQVHEATRVHLPRSKESRL